MTDNDLLARVDEWCDSIHDSHDPGFASLGRDLLYESAAALRACDAELATAQEREESWKAKAYKAWDDIDELSLVNYSNVKLRAELATARAVTRRLINIVDQSGPHWRQFVDSDAERAWLASVSPPASGEAP